MPADWVSTLIPVINAAGIPILAIGIILLLRAYQKATDTYRDISSQLKDENERLSKRLATAEANHFSDYEKVQAMASGWMETIRELQVRKVALLTQPETTASQETLIEVKKINEMIELLHNMASEVRETSMFNQVRYYRLNEQIQELTKQVGVLVDQIGDTKTRVAILGVITSTKALGEIKSQAESQKRGIVATHPEQALQSSTEEDDNLLGEGTKAIP